MKQHQWKKVNKIVDTALDLDKKERATYIEERCKDDKELKQQVTQLLASIEKSGTENFLGTPETYLSDIAGELSPGDAPMASSMIGQQVGNYSLHELIGHGGMGSVFKGERADEAYKKEVAVKILRRGMDTPSNIARFKRERNILANLDHSNIARLLDGGLTEEGLPYLVMEYVDGTPLLEYCNKHQLSVEKRLALFEQVCFAVQHAHQNAIIHRDLKPSNILVNTQGDVKVLDFGIAKLIEPDDEGASFQTRTGARMLTLGYAAPEQLASQTITTATDSYVLGILLYELLAGVHPFEMDEKSFVEIEEQIREQRPYSPSQRFSDLSTNNQQQIAEKRKTSPATLVKTLKGDLDAIVMKALRKEPNSRYSSAEQLLEDLNRQKTNLPIIAREDTFRYNASKFIKRHKTGLSVAAGFVLLLIGFTAFYTWQIAQERNKAQLEARKSQEVSTFLTDMFRASDPTFNPKDTVTAATFLKRGQERVEQLDGQPEVQAELLRVIGRAHIHIGNYDKAKKPLYRSLSIRKRIFQNPHSEIASSLREAGYLQRKIGNFAEAESLSREALDIQLATLGPDHKNTVKTQSQLAFVLSRQGKYKAADSLYAETLPKQRKLLSTYHPNIGTTLSDWALTLRQLGKFQKADTLKQQALEVWEQNYGRIHPQILQGLNDLAVVKEKMGNFAAADSLYQEALEINDKLYDKATPSTAQLLNNIGTTNIKAGRYEDAEPYLKKALDMRKELLRPNHPSMAESYINLGRLYVDQNKFAKAQPLIQKALKIDTEQHGKNHPYVAGDLRNLGFIAKQRGQYELAERHFKRSLEIMKKTLSSDHPSVAVSLASLGKVYLLQGNHEKAKPLLQEALEIRQKKFDQGDVRIAQSQVPLGATFIKSNNYEEAEKLLKAGYQTLKKERGPQHDATNDAKEYLVELYNSWGKHDLANEYKVKSP
ncbi:serine/threonine-protein kinase [Fodinibius halophilus]|uniref:Serine/threonine protein kinase n=1 Tax=Fodinibius halophilus TaxID=1736908 RepID=A0A6M1T8A6_9BACT|nr:serine/threonine-protein kinase [Fodinibius halophilus]NGP88231.1 serine/threonine protein kinase [Fodinibius halophilus]